MISKDGIYDTVLLFIGCPYIGRDFDDNWNPEDPTGESDEEFR